MEAIIGLIIGALIGAVIAGALLWVISKLGLGLSVDNFGWAMLAGLAIGVVTTIINAVIPGAEGLLGALIHLVVSAAVIFAAGGLLKGLSVNGPGGALLAAASYAGISYLLGLVLVTAT